MYSLESPCFLELSEQLFPRDAKTSSNQHGIRAISVRVIEVFCTRIVYLHSVNGMQQCDNRIMLIYLGPVVQSIDSLTSSLTVVVRTIPNSQVLLLKTCE